MKQGAVFLWLFILADSANAFDSIKITFDQANCIAENLETYLGYGTDPVIIVPDTCPNPPTNDDLMAAMSPQNSGAGFPTPKIGEGERVLILLHAQLRCLSELVKSGTISQDSDGLIYISFNKCKK